MPAVTTVCATRGFWTPERARSTRARSVSAGGTGGNVRGRKRGGQRERKRVAAPDRREDVGCTRGMDRSGRPTLREWGNRGAKRAKSDEQKLPALVEKKAPKAA